MIQIATTQSQSTRLIACGVEEKTADMVWTTWENEDEKLTKLSAIDEYAYEASCLNPIPAWSLSALLELLPKLLPDGSGDLSYVLKIQPCSLPGWTICYYAYSLDKGKYYRSNKSLIELCVIMIEELVKQGYKLNFTRFK